MLRYLILALVMAVCMLPTINVPAAAADDGGSYKVACETYVSTYDAGKSGVGFEATATDGCNTVKWVSSIGQGPGSGSVTFKTVGNVYPWEPGGEGLPSMAGGFENACKARAAEEANGFFTNKFKAPVGTEVTVRYRCD